MSKKKDNARRAAYEAKQEKENKRGDKSEKERFPLRFGIGILNEGKANESQESAEHFKDR